MSWAAIMGLDELLAKLQREAGTPGTPEHTGGVPVKALPLLGCTLGTPGTPQKSNAGEKAEPGHFRQSEPIERTGDDPDERRFCTQCLNLRGAVCIVAKPGGLVSAIVGYRPVQGIPQRCAGYSPNADDPDQRPGGERWPGLSNYPKGAK